jgi:hypothetical protein
MTTRFCALLAGATTALAASLAHADEARAPDRLEQQLDLTPQPSWEAIFGPFAYHWSNESKHTHVYLLGIERENADNTMWGLSVFQNSFGQPSAYAYYGYTWNHLFDSRPNWYVKLSGGVVYGYKDQYADKVPFNHDGFGLGIIPAIGYRLTPNDALQVGVLGTAGLIFTYNRRF